MEKVEALVSEELTRIVKDGITAEELAAAKQRTREGLKVFLADDGSLAALLAGDLRLGRPAGRMTEKLKAIEELTADDVREAFARHIDPGKLVVAVAGDFAKK
jgi:zinc protease